MSESTKFKLLITVGGIAVGLILGWGVVISRQMGDERLRELEARKVNEARVVEEANKVGVHWIAAERPETHLKEVILTRDDGKRIKIRSVAHHGAGAHLEIDELP